MVTIDNSRTARLAADIGGTFTDLALEQDGRRYSVKVLTIPHAPEEGVLEGIARVLKIAGIGPSDVASFVHGTTLATACGHRLRLVHPCLPCTVSKKAR
jgi:N-methylhydantoinase A/oxoprolinase/acetone carboxylase beta subunit